MTYLDLIRDAEHKLEHNEITLGEYNKMIEPLRRELEQEPEVGHWITEIKSDLRGDMWPTNPKCSKCGGEPYYSNTIYNYKFCPYCGIKMESGGESE